MRSLRVIIGAAMALSLMTAACGSDSTNDSTSADSGEVQPLAMSAATTDGGQFEFGSLEGQDAVLWFWAPW